MLNILLPTVMTCHISPRIPVISLCSSLNQISQQSTAIKAVILSVTRNDTLTPSAGFVSDSSRASATDTDHSINTVTLIIKSQLYGIHWCPPT